MKPFAKFALACLGLLTPLLAAADAAQDKSTVAALDTEYQAAVKANDPTAMGRILADDFVLVTGKGKAYTKADLLKRARDKTDSYEHQEDSEQTVRVYGDTAVVTALLWVKGANPDGAFDYKLWFSDTYARTPKGWRYVFGQASTRLP
jgi:ketosteroid isomerase-like protein